MEPGKPPQDPRDEVPEDRPQEITGTGGIDLSQLGAARDDD